MQTRKKTENICKYKVGNNGNIANFVKNLNKYRQHAKYRHYEKLTSTFPGVLVREKVRNKRRIYE